MLGRRLSAATRDPLNFFIFKNSRRSHDENYIFIVKGRDWKDYPPEEITDAFEDINDHPFDGMPGVFYEV